MMIATGFLSMWVSNTATTLMMLPIGLSVLALVVERSAGEQTGAEMQESLKEGTISDVVDDPNVRMFGICLVLAIAWSASMGGLGTLLGSPPNAIVAGYAADELGRPIGFLQWMMLGLPLAAIFIVLGWLLMVNVLYRFKLDAIPGGREMIRELAAGRSVGAAFDTRIDQGELVPFFGVPAPTNTLPAMLGLRGYKVVPTRAVRLSGCRYRIEVMAPLAPADAEAPRQAQVLDLTRQINGVFESWIREDPGQWICMKRRWPKDHATARAADV
jgi:MFS family permease